jgi:hypothetical protein
MKELCEGQRERLTLLMSTQMMKKKIKEGMLESLADIVVQKMVSIFY